MVTIHRYALILITILLLPVVALGQEAADVCEIFLQQAYEEMQANCAALGWEACYNYGNYGELSATFYSEGQPGQVLDGVLSSPAARAALLSIEDQRILETITSTEFIYDISQLPEEERARFAEAVVERETGSTLDPEILEQLEQMRWGVGIMNTQADLPVALGGFATFALLGGVRIENVVTPEQALLLNEEAVTIELEEDSFVTVFSVPADNGFQEESIAVGRLEGEVEIDAITPDENWVRVFYIYPGNYGDRASGWVRVADLPEDSVPDTLPIMDGTTLSAMQSVYISSESFDLPECGNVPPSALLIQTPRTIESNFVINGMPVLVSSTAMIRHIAPRLLEFSALTGFTVLNPGSTCEQIIPPGYTITVPLADPANLGIDNLENDLPIVNPCPIDDPELTEAQTLAQAEPLEEFPERQLNYPITVPDLVCPSGVGIVECELSVDPISLIRVIEACEGELLSEDVCVVYPQ